MNRAHAAARHCTVPYFGFKAKHGKLYFVYQLDCTVPYFGFKAKLSRERYAMQPNCTVPYFGFKAKQPPKRRLHTRIVLCLILDSRQNRAP